ncbi:MAG: hypothetical protein WBG92_17550 [Thiohalocapsa sp.]
MNCAKRRRCLLARYVTVTTILPLSLLSAAEAIGSTRPPWLMPFDVGQDYRPPIDQPVVLNPSQKQIYEFAWDSFIALNWPYDVGGPRGKPDGSGSLAPIVNDTRQPPVVVWETYMAPSDVFVDPDDWDVIWTSPEFIPLDTGFRRLEPPSYNGRFAPGINQPYTHANVPTGPVVDQHKEYLRYEVTLNQSYFSYIKEFRYYNAHIQSCAVKAYLDYAWQHEAAPDPIAAPTSDSQYFQPLPTGLEFYLDGLPDYAQQGLVEVKAAWKVLETSGDNPDIPGRYFRRYVKFPQPDGSYSERTLVGLVGLHLHRVTPFGHLPSTFEQIDNVELRREWRDPLPLPQTPALNPGTDRKGYRADRRGAKYPNGYEIGGVTGEAGIIPEPFYANEQLPSKNERKQVNVSRVTPIPREVARLNRKYQYRLKDSVWRYYQLIGTQNLNVTERNKHLGPGIPGAQFSNVQNLVNSTLESYTQKGFSCARCHINAFPLGVTDFPPFESRFKDLHVMSFLLLNAKPGDGPDWCDDAVVTP